MSDRENPPTDLFDDRGALTLPKNLTTQAEWWCAVNGDVDPPGVGPLTTETRDDLFERLSAVPGVVAAALRLWRERCDAGLYPQNGQPLDAQAREEYRRIFGRPVT